jgi:hypothetical protein
MKWVLSLFCFISIAAFSQTKEPLLKKLKETQDRLSGKLSDTIPYREFGQGPSAITEDQKKPRVTIIIPREEKNGPGTIPNAIPRSQHKPLIMDGNQESVVMALPQDNMPCVVPNMELYKVMPNAAGKIMLEKPIDPGIYLQKPKS